MEKRKMFCHPLRNSRVPSRGSLLLCLVISVASAATPAFPRSSESAARLATSSAANDGRLIGGDFRIDGVPREYQPRRSYPITVIIAQPGQSEWGFELTARFTPGGAQAGTWSAKDSMVRVDTESGIQYARQTDAGRRQGTKDGPVEYHLDWTAPDSAGELIIFSATGHAGSAGDTAGDTAGGSFAYTAGGFTKPATAPPQEAEPVEVEASAPRKSTRMQETSRLVDLPSPVDLKRGSMEIMIQHRFLESVSDAGAGDAFGIDSGANMSIGFNYAFTDRISAGVARTRFDQIVELSGTYEVLTSQESKWKLAVRGGVEGKGNFHQDYSPFVQLAGSFDYRRVRLNVVPTMVFNSRPDEFDREHAINADSNNTFALGLGTDIAISRRLSLIGEYVPRLAGFGGVGRRRDQVAAGVVVRTWGHVFTIEVATSRDFTPSKYGVNAEDRSLSLGFNLYRRMR